MPTVNVFCVGEIHTEWSLDKYWCESTPSCELLPPPKRRRCDWPGLSVRLFVSMIAHKFCIDLHENVTRDVARGSLVNPHLNQRIPGRIIYDCELKQNWTSYHHRSIKHLKKFGDIILIFKSISQTHSIPDILDSGTQGTHGVGGILAEVHSVGIFPHIELVLTKTNEHF